MQKGQVAARAPIKVSVEAGKDYWWCACGRSASQPFCDGSHKGSEFCPVKWTAEADGDKWFCACKQTDGQPFCDGSHKALGEAETSDRPVIQPRESGPLAVKNLKTFVDHDGNAIEVKPVMALCRCGHSKNKPFCDGSHKEAGFSSANETENPDGRVFAYEGGDITVQYNKLLCSHAAECGRRNLAVFDPGKKPWVQPDEGSVESVLEVLHACPSGALARRSAEGASEHLVGEEVMIRVEKNGPYQVRNLALEGARFAATASERKYVLCRCGLSRNKPFCDGTHRDAGWRDGS
ncbi:MAG: CDGSH iron-sulfur domain-containing protein [Nitratireductor sp.]|nr:CDGSH iron-sulfur domain-containing protein [Nitratireductor sp.]